jgi:hypothetical protein
MSSQSKQPINHLEDSSSPIFTTFRREHSPVHTLRIAAQNSSLCDARAQQYTAWLTWDLIICFPGIFNHKETFKLTLSLSGRLVRSTPKTE